ncbi:MAG TPA: amidohydrolase family protein [Stellaceae bacterium]|nr:amidohydrolase family protein [Stellaceae bacterium]
MRYLDTVTHFFPKRFFETMLALPGFSGDIGKRMRGVRSLWDLDVRMKVVERFADYRQILSLGLPPIDMLGTSGETPALARMANDGLAELVARHPDRFAGYLAGLPMNAPDAAAREAERALGQGGACGIQVHTNINGATLADEKYLPIFEVAARHDRPVLIHPARRPDMPDFPADKMSRYEIWAIFGWPYETTAVMTQMIFSGFMDRARGAKILIHHMGAMVPFFESRIRHGWAELGTRTTSTDPSMVPVKLTKPVLDYFREFYGDTALAGSRSGIQCGLDFFGADRVLFASDCPFDAEGGPLYIAETIEALGAIDLAPADRDKICFANAEKMFGIAPLK